MLIIGEKPANGGPQQQQGMTLDQAKAQIRIAVFKDLLPKFSGKGCDLVNFLWMVNTSSEFLLFGTLPPKTESK